MSAYTQLIVWHAGIQSFVDCFVFSQYRQSESLEIIHQRSHMISTADFQSAQMQAKFSMCVYLYSNSWNIANQPCI